MKSADDARIGIRKKNWSAIGNKNHRTETTLICGYPICLLSKP
jgi:hypothetical protein